MKFLEYDRFIDKRETKRYDLTPILKNREAFRSLIEDLSAPFENVQISTIAGIESFGLILGAAVAYRLGKGFLPIRKGGKLACIPEALDRITLTDYSGIEKTLEIKRELITPAERFLVIDEWIDTGAQVKATINLIERNGGVIAGISTIGIEVNQTTEELMRKYLIKAIGINPYG